MKVICIQLFMAFIYSLLGATFVKGTIDQYREKHYYLAGFEVFGAFYIMLLMAKIVLGVNL